MQSRCQFSSYSRFEVSFSQRTSLPITRSRDVISCHVTASSCELQLSRNEMYSIRKFSLSTATSTWLAVKWRHFRVTSSHLRSRDVIFCHVTASSGELQPWRKWNVQYTPVFALLHPLPGDFRSINVTSGSLPVTRGHVTSFCVTWLPPPASYSLVGSEMYCIRQFSAFHRHFQVISAQMTSLPGHNRSP